MASSRRRGRRLPQRVYWFRRGLLLVVAVALVVGIAQLLGGSNTGSPDKASTTSAAPSGSTTPGPQVGPVAPSTTPLTSSAAQADLQPSGDCSPEGVSVVPSVPKAVAGGTIGIHLQLEGTEPACTFAINASSVAVKITNDQGKVWSTQDCSNAVRPDSVVVRSGVPTDVVIPWSGTFSDTGCPGGMPWATQGFYHVMAAAQGSAPADVQFEVVLPKRGVVTKTAKPHPTPTASASTKATPTPTPTPTPHQGKRSGGSACGGDNAAGTC